MIHGRCVVRNFEWNNKIYKFIYKELYCNKNQFKIMQKYKKKKKKNEYYKSKLNKIQIIFNYNNNYNNNNYNNKGSWLLNIKS